jgi:undecaprenyl diphosphate synthase
VKKAVTEVPGALPVHVAIIMDGNGRWARERGKPRSAGHREGAKALNRLVPASIELGIKYLTVFAFSVDNWRRPSAEVSFLMGLLRRYIRAETPTLVEKGVRLRVIGDVSRLSEALQAGIARALSETAAGDKLNLTVALNYGGQEDVVQAARRIAAKVEKGILRASAVDKIVFEAELLSAGLPPVDLLIRTGAEMRLSNFLLYQCSYAELYFTEKYWPDFGKEDLAEALREFARRERRFGSLRKEE